MIFRLKENFFGYETCDTVSWEDKAYLKFPNHNHHHHNLGQLCNESHVEVMDFKHSGIPLGCTVKIAHVSDILPHTSTPRG
jgi:hypothetical protein